MCLRGTLNDMSRYLSWAAILMLGTVGCAIEGPSNGHRDEGGERTDDGDASGVDASAGGETTDEPEAEEPDPAGGGQGGNGGAGSGDGAGDGGAPPTQADFTTQVCYPGSDGSNDTCLPLVAFDAGFPAAYDYPSSSQLAYQSPVRFIDLDAVSPSIMLAPSFALNELMQAHKGRYALFQPHTVSQLQSMRDQTGGALVIHSAFRNPGYNATVGGATYSRHMYGDGVDMHSAVVSLNTMKSLCQSHGADYVSVYATHVHCDWRYAGNHPSFYGTSPMQIGAPNEIDDEQASVTDLADGALTADVDGFDEGEPYREWTSFDTRGHRIETVTGESYLPPAHAATVEVMVGGRVALRIDGKGTREVTRLPEHQVQLRLDTLSATPVDEHHHD